MGTKPPPPLVPQTSHHRRSDPFLDADEAVAEPVATGSAHAVVPYQLQIFRPVADGYLSTAGLCVSEFVRPCRIR